MRRQNVHKARVAILQVVVVGGRHQHLAILFCNEWIAILSTLLRVTKQCEGDSK